MHLVEARVGPIKSIETPTDVKIEKGVTVLVGMNEAGKTVFLQALQKSDDVFGVAKFDHIDDYPRKNLNAYERRHETAPDTATVLTYEASAKEIADVKTSTGISLPAGFKLSINTDYKNKSTIGLKVDAAPAISALSNRPDLSTDFKGALLGKGSFAEVVAAAKEISLTEADEKCVAELTQRLEKAKAAGWGADAVGYEVWIALASKAPKFMYFGDYEVLPSKMNLADLAERVERSKTDPTALTSEHRGILALLRMANISIDAFAKPTQIEALISRIEAVSINLTDQIMEFWKQNENLQVKVDIRSDPTDSAPFNNGSNLYIRIANTRHRGVSTPFKQRSRGFIWFFSFLVWFDSVQHQLEKDQNKGRPLILLLDEPGLSLHALAQGDFLRYIDSLSKKHQVIYSTHSPFMIHSDRLFEVRVVEDRDAVGTVVSDNVSWTDERTIFPLQAALGWSVAQNLFISEKNLLVEGAADLVYLQTMSALAEAAGKTSLRSDITIVPVGGLDKVVTFVALLGANKLKIAVLHDYNGAADQKLLEAVREKLINPKAVFDASQFRDLEKIGKSGKPSDLEDLFEVSTYLHYFCAAYTAELGGLKIAEADLLPGDRVIGRLERFIAAKEIVVRPSGGFNHYLPAVSLARDPSVVDATSLERFVRLFAAANAIL